MNVYTGTHRYYCGIDLHARFMYICILDSHGDIVYHKKLSVLSGVFFKSHPAVSPRIGCWGRMHFLLVLVGGFV